jgi:hypothetical protein
MVDPKLTILGLLKDNWSLATEPRFSSDWYNEKLSLPQVTVTHVITNPSFFAFSNDLPNADRRIQGFYNVDVWSLDQEERWQLLMEVDRVMKSFVSIPGGGLELLEVTSWRDQNEGDVDPPIFRSQLRLEVLYYG